MLRKDLYKNRFQKTFECIFYFATDYSLSKYPKEQLLLQTHYIAMIFEMQYEFELKIMSATPICLPINHWKHQKNQETKDITMVGSCNPAYFFEFKVLSLRVFFIPFRN